jgi:hypothetical protein
VIELEIACRLRSGSSVVGTSAPVAVAVGNCSAVTVSALPWMCFAFSGVSINTSFANVSLVRQPPSARAAA